ncbi:hypothetical protein M2280_005300 [Prescottella agglutinans]|uniref:Uncharacterized protein n=1 Tax=Prescottella agglutinans TaxID=1644129 RepID=A0ABT6ML31_9NOCA|nr:hypothetical protein [Prescottella agglutinans]
MSVCRHSDCGRPIFETSDGWVHKTLFGLTRECPVASVFRRPGAPTT